MPKSACTNGSATGIDHMPTLPMVLTATANPSRRHAADVSTSLSWRSCKSMELPGDEFMTPTSHGPPVSSTQRGPMATANNRHVCERLHGVLTAKGSLFLLRVRAAGNSSTGSTYPRFRRRTAVSNRGPHIRDYFQKTESTWNEETDVRLYTMIAMSALCQKRTFDVPLQMETGARTSCCCWQIFQGLAG